MDNANNGALFIFSCKEKINDITEKEYQSAVSYMYANYNNKTAFNLYTSANWFKDNSGVWFVDHGVDGKTYKTVDFVDNEVKLLFDHKKLASALNELDWSTSWRATTYQFRM